MEKEVEFNIVYHKNENKIKKYLSNVPRSIDCINHNVIINRLTKNDHYQVDPSDEIINSFLVKSLQMSFNQRHGVESIYYTISSLDDEIINNIKNFVNKLSDDNIVFKLHVEKEENYSGVKDLFNNIIFFTEDEKA